MDAIVPGKMVQGLIRRESRRQNIYMKAIAWRVRAARLRQFKLLQGKS
jgi:hypothetical protein